MEHAVIKITVLLIYAGLIGYAAYKLLIGYVERRGITKRRNPMFADVLRGLIGAGIGADIAFAVCLIAEGVR